MKRRDFSVAVTGLNATDNPGPGVTVVRSLMHDEAPPKRIIGLTYDTLDPGVYAKDQGIDSVYLIPYPSQGADALLARLEYIHARDPIDVLIPTLDSELPAVAALEDDLRRLGIRTYIPTRQQYDLRSKTQLMELGRQSGVLVPAAKVLMEVKDLYRIHEEIPYPFMLKGVFYGADKVSGLDEAIATFHKVVAKWGIPVIAQRFYPGEEYDVVAVGDGKGGLVGAVPMKKISITDKGKGWAGVAVRDPHLLDVTERFMKATKWRGPCEVEVLKTADERYYLLEINPRFPAWSYLSAGAGQNLPMAVARLAMGEDVGTLPDFKAGTMFVRISLDQIASMEDFQTIASTGALHHSAPQAPQED